MVLRLEAETSLGEQSIRPVIKPLSGRLSWFRAPLAGLLTFVGGHEMLPDRAFAQSLPQSSEAAATLSSLSSETAEAAVMTPLTLELSSKVSALSWKASQLGIEDLTGELLTNAYVDPITGDRMLGLRNMVFKFGMDGEPKLIPNQLDKINLQDPRISMADSIPPRSQDPIIVDPDVEEHVANLGKVLGIEDPQVTGILTTPSYEIFRLNNDLIFLRPSEGPNAGQFIFGNAGWQVILTGWIMPETAMLSPEQSATGGGTTEIPAKPVEKSAAYQRVVNNLRELMSRSPQHSSDNEFGLDPAEVAEYKANPNKTIFDTFEVWSKPNGDPWGIIVKGPRPGFFQGLIRPENIENVKGALDLLYSIDPTMFDTLEQYGLKAVAGNTTALTIRGGASTFDERTVYLNEINTPEPVSRLGALIHMFIILDEARHSYTRRNSISPDILDPNLGIDKALWVNKWIDDHLYAFTAGEQRALRSLSNIVIAYYTQHPEEGKPL